MNECVQALARLQMSRVGSGSHGTAGRKGGKAEGGKAEGRKGGRRNASVGAEADKTGNRDLDRRCWLQP